MSSLLGIVAPVTEHGRTKPLVLDYVIDRGKRRHRAEGGIAAVPSRVRSALHLKAHVVIVATISTEIIRDGDLGDTWIEAAMLTPHDVPVGVGMRW